MTFLTLAEFAGSLSIILVLALMHRTLHRKTRGRVSPQVILGALYGCVALVQMHRPLEPFDGILIDMRNIPIALAGAFLGRAGLAMCLLIAVVTRVHLGGVGAFSGVIGMLIAGGMGYLWHHITAREGSRGLFLMLILAAMMSTHIIGAVFLPAQSFYWFFQEAAAPIVALNLLAVPITALVLEHERRLILSEDRLKASAHADPETGLLTWPHFKRELAFLMTAAPLGHVAGVAVVRVINRKWQHHFFRTQDKNLLMGAMRMRLTRITGQSGLAGTLPNGWVVLPVSAQAMMDADKTEEALRTAIESEQFVLPGGLLSRAHVAVSLHAAATHADMAQLLQKLDRPQGNRRRDTAKSAAKRSLGGKRRRASMTPQKDVLFDKAALLMATRSS